MKMEARRFACSEGGELARKRRRRRAALVGVSVLTWALALVTLWQGRTGPAVLAAGAALLTWAAQRWSRELDLLWVEVKDDTLVMRTKRRLLDFPLTGARARRLSHGEVEHLEGLARYASPFLASASYDSHLLGEFDLYGTRLGNAVLVSSGEDQVVVTPDDPQAFLDAVLAASGPRTNRERNVVEFSTQ